MTLCPSSPCYLQPANIPPECQKYVGPDANGDNQNALLRGYITAHNNWRSMRERH